MKQELMSDLDLATGPQGKIIAVEPVPDNTSYKDEAKLRSLCTGHPIAWHFLVRIDYGWLVTSQIWDAYEPVTAALLKEIRMYVGLGTKMEYRYMRFKKYFKNVSII
jgi:hypothetical protein